MRKNLSLTLLFFASLLMLSFQAFSQSTVRVDQRIQQTVTSYSRIDISQWLRVGRFESRDMEVLNLSLSGESFRGGTIEIFANRRIVGRMQFRNRNSRANFILPTGITLDRVELRVSGEVYVERVAATLKDRRYRPIPRPRPRR